MQKPGFSESHAWHPSQVTTTKLSQLYKRIDAVLEELFSRDEDGDFPVEVRLVNRTLHETMAGYLPVPYLYRAETQDDFDEIMRSLLSNIGRSTRDLERVIQARKDAELSEPSCGDLKLKAEICHLLGGAPTASDEQILHNIHAAISRPPVVEEKIVSYIPELVEPKDLVRGDQVILFEGESRKHAYAEVVHIVPACAQLTDSQIVEWFKPPANVTARKMASWRKGLDYARVVFKRKDGTYLVAPHAVGQLQSFVVKIVNVRSQDS